MDTNSSDRVAKLREERRRFRLCRECGAALTGKEKVRCAKCQAIATHKQRERRAAVNAEKRSEVISQVLPEVLYGWVLMLTNLALVDDTNRMEAYFDELEKGFRDIEPPLTHKPPTKPNRIEYTQKWEAANSMKYESGDNLTEIPEWPKKQAVTRDWSGPVPDNYILARMFYTQIAPQFEAQVHRQTWQHEMLPRISEIRCLMELHHNDLYEENTAIASAVTELEALADETTFNEQCLPTKPQPDVSLLDLWSLLDSMESEEVGPSEILERSLHSGEPLLESRKFEELLKSFSR